MFKTFMKDNLPISDMLFLLEVGRSNGLLSIDEEKRLSELVSSQYKKLGFIVVADVLVSLYQKFFNRGNLVISLQEFKILCSRIIKDIDISKYNIDLYYVKLFFILQDEDTELSKKEVEDIVVCIKKDIISHKLLSISVAKLLLGYISNKMNLEGMLEAVQQISDILKEAEESTLEKVDVLI